MNSRSGRTVRKLMTQVSGALLAAFLVPAASLHGQIVSLPPQAWPNTKPITVSFAPDLVPIGRYRNELSMTLDAKMSREVWQVEMLRAFQTWARYANLQFAVVPDSPRAFGVPGLWQRDPRFGDIRLGAFPQEEVLGNAIPFTPEAGSWAGDILLDSSRTFGMQRLNQDEFVYDLFSVMLHETGNSLGLVDDEWDPESVMFFAYVTARQDLSWKDVLAIQTLYGPPSADPYERNGGNDSWELATEIRPAADFVTSRRIAVPGQLSSGSDVDVYVFEMPNGFENCWIRLQAAGKSLLVGQFTALDGQLNELVRQQAYSPLDNTVSKEITSRQAGELVYVVVEAGQDPDFDFGDYQLVLDFRPGVGEFDPAEDDDDQEQERFFEAGDAALTDQLFDLAGLLDSEVIRETNRTTAPTLESPPGFTPGNRFEIVSSLGAVTDIDLYRFVTGERVSGVASLNLGPLGTEVPRLTLRVLDSAGRAVATTGPLRREITGDVKLTVTGLKPGTPYFVSIQSAQGNTLASNYLLTIDVPNQSSSLAPIASVRLTPTTRDRFGEFVARKTQLFRFDTAMTSTDVTRQAVQVTITNATGRVESTFAVRPGIPMSTYVWLPAGTHYVRFTAVSRSGARIVASTTTLRGAALSDDEGPILIDPSGNPISGPQSNSPSPPTTPSWRFPLTFIWLYDLVVPPLNPWFNG